MIEQRLRNLIIFCAQMVEFCRPGHIHYLIMYYNYSIHVGVIVIVLYNSHTVICTYLYTHSNCVKCIL